MSKPTKRNDMSDMVHRIKAEELKGRRDFNADELGLMRAGRDEEAKAAWHKRKDTARGR